jgi:two-component system, OmpR family, response regulator VicR
VPKLMIVDDEDYSRDFLARSGRRKGYETCVAGDGKAALEMFKTEKPDIIFLDIHLPEINGEKVFIGIRAMDPKVKVYFMSGSEPDIDRIKTTHATISGFILKPFEIQQVIQILEENKK